jgi:hypothetical protein
LFHQVATPAHRATASTVINRQYYTFVKCKTIQIPCIDAHELATKAEQTNKKTVGRRNPHPVIAFKLRQQLLTLALELQEH